MPATCVNPCATSLTLCSIGSPLEFHLIWQTGLQPMIFQPFGTSEGATSVQTCHASMDSSSFMSPCSHFSLCSEAMASAQFWGSCASLSTSVARARSVLVPPSTIFCALEQASLACTSSHTWSKWLVRVRPCRAAPDSEGFIFLKERQGSGCDGIMGVFIYDLIGVLSTAESGCYVP